MPSPLECFKDNILKWEGGFQDMPNDPGNWVNGVLVGTMCGVTPAALAAHRGIHVTDVTPEMMRSVTVDEAAQIGLDNYYVGPGFDRIEWGPPTDSIVDFGWGSGPVQAIKSMQRLVGADVDGVIGSQTAGLWSEAIHRVGPAEWTKTICAMRQGFYDLICARNPRLAMFRQGWANRANWFLPGNLEWWGKWEL